MPIGLHLGQSYTWPMNTPYKHKSSHNKGAQYCVRGWTLPMDLEIGLLNSPHRLDKGQCGPIWPSCNPILWSVSANKMSFAAYVTFTAQGKAWLHKLAEAIQFDWNIWRSIKTDFMKLSWRLGIWRGWRRGIMDWNLTCNKSFLLFLCFSFQALWGFWIHYWM